MHFFCSADLGFDPLKADCALASSSSYSQRLLHSPPSLGEQVYEVRVAYDYIVEKGGGTVPAVKCEIEKDEFRQAATSGCASEGTSGNLEASFKKPDGFTAGAYTLHFNFASGAWVSVLQMGYK